MNIQGWGEIIPQLCAFFVVLRRRRKELTPFNLFLSGRPGTNKTEGIVELARFLGHRAAMVDSSTLDDASELAGIVDLQANRERGEARIIRGELLDSDVLVLDEFLNARKHVLPQFRLVLQGYLVMLGKRVDMPVKAIVGTGNLSGDMEFGEANLLDSPTADRFAMLIKVPSLQDMKAEEVAAILRSDETSSFEEAFRAAFEGANHYFDEVERDSDERTTVYLQALLGQLRGSPFAFEGRRGKLLRQFIFAAIALCRAQPERDVATTVWSVVRDCLSYHKLSGIDLDEQSLKIAHEIAFQLACKDTVEAKIAAEPDLASQVALLVKNLSRVTPITKADVLGRVIRNGDVALKLAVCDLVRTPLFEQEPRELKALFERLELKAEHPVQLSAEQMIKLSGMSAAEVLIFELAGGNEQEMAKLLDRVQTYLKSWIG